MRDTLETRLLAKLDRSNGCWLWKGSLFKTGYGQIAIEKGRPGYTHRVSYELFCGYIPAHLYVLHRCDVRNCCNPEHLFLGTQKENVHDMIAKGKQPIGEKHVGHKLTDKQIQEIISSPLSSLKLSSEYGVSSSLIRRIRRGERWRHITK